MNSNSLQFYRDRADQARREGEEATLSHVRERCLRAEEAWTILADRIAQTAAKRQANEREKAALPLQDHEQ